MWLHMGLYEHHKSLYWKLTGEKSLAISGSWTCISSTSDLTNDLLIYTPAHCCSGFMKLKIQPRSEDQCQHEKQIRPDKWPANLHPCPLLQWFYETKNSAKIWRSVSARKAKKCIHMKLKLSITEPKHQQCILYTPYATQNLVDETDPNKQTP